MFTHIGGKLEIRLAHALHTVVYERFKKLRVLIERLAFI